MTKLNHGLQLFVVCLLGDSVVAFWLNGPLKTIEEVIFPATCNQEERMESFYKLTGLFLVLFEICGYQLHNVAVAGDVQRRDIFRSLIKGLF